MKGGNININRDNYESFFLLYLDNELSKEERLAVEQFAALYPYLGIELRLLMQTRLEPDASVKFPGMEDLLKKEDVININAANYEAWLIDYLDNELTILQQKEVENFIAANPAVQASFSLLKQTRLLPDSDIIFPNKNLLYRSEKTEKIRPVGWWRLAAAAVLLAVVSGTAFWMNNNNTVSPQGTELAVQRVNEEENLPIPNTSSINNEGVQAVIPVTNKNNIGETTETQIKPERSVSTEKINEAPYINQPENNIAASVSHPKENTDMMMPEREQPVIAENALLTNASKKTQPDAVTPANTQPLYTVNKTPVSTNRMDESEPEKRSKFRGFFRKLTRTVEKTTHVDMTDGEDRLLVGALAIKL